MHDDTKNNFTMITTTITTTTTSTATTIAVVDANEMLMIINVVSLPGCLAKFFILVN